MENPLGTSEQINHWRGGPGNIDFQFAFAMWILCPFTIQGILHNLPIIWKSFVSPLPKLYISTKGFLTVGCLLVWLPFAWFCKCICGVRVCLHVYMWTAAYCVELGWGTKKLEQEDSVSSVCPPRRLSREAYVHVMRPILACLLCLCSLYILTHAVRWRHLVYLVIACSHKCKNVLRMGAGLSMNMVFNSPFSV